jgi:hypothetical protein
MWRMVLLVGAVIAALIAKRGKHHKNITEWAWQLLLQERRW